METLGASRTHVRGGKPRSVEPKGPGLGPTWPIPASSVRFGPLLAREQRSSYFHVCGMGRKVICLEMRLATLFFCGGRES